ncbi:MAG TPA: hypothetical protein VMU15_12015 [Anaeromyxobacter sp.]|nr:hypothetical protein [Anaeromyxobacter sp.]
MRARAPRGGFAAGAAAKALLAWLLILGLLAMVGYLISERNARTWSLVPEEGRLVVSKGMLLPMGRSHFKTSDPAQAKAYAPLVPPPGKSLPEERTFQEQGDLDRALYDLLSAWAREDVASNDPARLERGLGYLERALLLPGISAAQRDDLTALRAESGYFEARRLLERARAELSEAAEKLRLAAASRSPHAADAQALLHELAPLVDAAAGVVRASGAPPAAAPPASSPDGTGQSAPSAPSAQ